jgi:hypothetical protein
MFAYKIVCKHSLSFYIAPKIEIKMKKIIILLLSVFASFVSQAQSAFLFHQLLYTGGYARNVDKNKKIPLGNFNGYCVFQNDTLRGSVQSKQGTICVQEDPQNRLIRVSDSNLRAFAFEKATQKLAVRRLSDGRFYRVVLDTLGFAIFDSHLQLKESEKHTTGREWILTYKGKVRYVSVFWRSNAKKNIVRALNELFEADLRYEEFDNLALLVESILSLENRVIKKHLLGNG